MPTARELLEQADAMMRRNRAPLGAADDIPELTDEVAIAADGVVAAARGGAANEALAPTTGAGDVPELTDAVAYVDAVSIEAVPEDDATRWLESELGTQSVIGGEDPDSVALVPPATLRIVLPSEPRDEPRADESAEPAEAPLPPPQSAAAALAAYAASPVARTEPAPDYAFEAIEREPPAPSEPPSVETLFDEELAGMSVVAAESAADEPDSEAATAVEPRVANDDPARWAALAEEIRMQVLQRIDIFTDTGLQQQLTARLQPIVDRASADLVAAINQHVGTLLRAYVAEAIEREIEKWREEGR